MHLFLVAMDIRLVSPFAGFAYSSAPSRPTNRTEGDAGLPNVLGYGQLEPHWKGNRFRFRLSPEFGTLDLVFLVWGLKPATEGPIEKNYDEYGISGTLHSTKQD